MRIFRICKWLMLIVALFVANGCSGGIKVEDLSLAKSAPGNGRIPPPSALRATSYMIQGLSHWGSEFSYTLPNSNARRVSRCAHLAPTAANGRHDLADTAYAMYEFQLAGYDMEASLRLTWIETQDFADAWVGLADFKRDRWEWRAMPDDGCLAFNPERNISDTGLMYATVLFAGTYQQKRDLQYLRVGPESAPPAIWLTASPEADNAPVKVNFDAAGSYDPDGGALTKYEWDWDGDGIFDADSGAIPSVSHLYTEVGDFQAVLRVTDDENVRSSRTIKIQALSFNCAPGTLYAIPLVSHAGVSKPVRVIVTTGQPVYPLQFMESVTVSFGQCGAYVPDSYNFGSPGGERSHTDGYWALLGPPAIPDDNYIDLPSRIPSPGSLPDKGLNFLRFSVVPMGPSDVPATISNGAILFSFQVSFSQPGTYALRFVQDFQSEDMTFYYDAELTRYHWTLDQAGSIVIE